MKLHLACGKNYLQGWINADIDSKQKVDIILDCTKSIPFGDKSVDFIYCEHFMEHITLRDGISFLSECRRVLKNAMRISTPNLKVLAQRYVMEDLIRWGNWQPESLCDMMNEGMRKWGRQYVYDMDKLIGVVRKAGFHKITRQDYRKSPYPELRNLESRPYNNELVLEIA